MDDLNMLHIEADSVLDLGHGVRIASQHDINSGTMVCFLDGRSNFHYGFAYKNGSNLRVVMWQDGEKKMKTVLKGSFVIAFDDVTTMKRRNEDFVENDFNQINNWLNVEAQNLVRDELLSLVEKKDEIEQIVEGLCDLTIGELQEVRKSIKDLKTPPVNN